MESKKVLIIGIDPQFIDFTSPEFAAFPQVTAETIKAGLNGARDQINHKGHNAEICWIDFGQTAANVLEKTLNKTDFDIVLIGAGIRVPNSNVLLFEQLINIIHKHAQNANICFNTNPGDTIVTVERWL